MTETLAARAATMSDDMLRRAYELMYLARRLDTATVMWQRQGVIPSFPPLCGQEAAQVGLGLAVDRGRDMVFPTYRDHAVALSLGVDLEGYYASHLNLWHGGLYDPQASRFAPLQAVVAGSVTHAVGWALGSKLDGAHGVAVALLGDGASSEGDVHEAMNFAAVFGVPVVFFVQNNRWALSVPLEREVAGGSVAARAAGYGMAASTVDGDDVVEVFRAASAAVDEARTNGRPVVVEAMTYRRGPHSTSDDPARYRDDDTSAAAGRDPLERAAGELEARGLFDRSWLDGVETRATARIEQLHRYVTTASPTAGDDMFTQVFQEATPRLRAQHEQWRAERAMLEAVDV